MQVRYRDGPDDDRQGFRRRFDCQAGFFEGAACCVVDLVNQDGDQHGVRVHACDIGGQGQQCRVQHAAHTVSLIGVGDPPLSVRVGPRLGHVTKFGLKTPRHGRLVRRHDVGVCRRVPGRLGLRGLLQAALQRVDSGIVVLPVRRCRRGGLGERASDDGAGALLGAATGRAGVGGAGPAAETTSGGSGAATLSRGLACASPDGRRAAGYAGRFAAFHLQDVDLLLLEKRQVGSTDFGRPVDVGGRGRGVPENVRLLKDTDGSDLAEMLPDGPRHVRLAQKAVAEDTLPRDAVGQLDRDGDQHGLAADGHSRLLDRHEARERRHDRELLAEGDDALLDRLRHSTTLDRLEVRGEDVVYFGPRPQRRDDIMAIVDLGQVKLQHALVRACTRPPPDSQRAPARPGIAAVDDKRLDVEEVGDPCRVRYKIDHLQAVGEGQRDVRQDRRLDAPGEAGDRLVGIGIQQDELRLAAAGAGHAVEQVAVDAVADPEGEDPGSVGVASDGVDDRHVVADVPVGQEQRQAHGPDGLLLVIGPVEPHAVGDEFATAVDGAPLPGEAHVDAMRREDRRQVAVEPQAECEVLVDRDPEDARLRCGVHVRVGDRELDGAVVGGQCHQLPRHDRN